ncbi:MAG: hypothetical protein DWH79_10010 [Planctomycetota bacterium]|nr:MAG: hypothetical protein DWH79_10010 [Planctomycetota bacterium]
MLAFLHNCLSHTPQRLGCGCRLPPPRRLLAGLLVGWLVIGWSWGAFTAADSARGAELPPTLPSSESALGRASIVVAGVPARQAAVIVERAEEVRRLACEFFHGDSSPAAWTEPCLVQVHTTTESFAAALGCEPPAAVRGATSLEFVGDRITLRRIDVIIAGADTIPDGLAHEIVHVVLADRFTAAPLPRWADEGLAVLFDDAPKQAAHARDFEEARRHRRALPVHALLALEDYPPDTQGQEVFYGQSAALIRWLIAERGIERVMKCLEEAALSGSHEALARHFALDSPEDFAPAWITPAPIESLAASQER